MSTPGEDTENWWMMYFFAPIIIFAVLAILFVVFAMPWVIVLGGIGLYAYDRIS